MKYLWITSFNSFSTAKGSVNLLGFLVKITTLASLIKEFIIPTNVIDSSGKHEKKNCKKIVLRQYFKSNGSTIRNSC